MTLITLNLPKGAQKNTTVVDTYTCVSNALGNRIKKEDVRNAVQKYRNGNSKIHIAEALAEYLVTLETTLFFYTKTSSDRVMLLGLKHIHVCRRAIFLQDATTNLDNPMAQLIQLIKFPKNPSRIGVSMRLVQQTIDLEAIHDAVIHHFYSKGLRPILIISPAGGIPDDSMIRTLENIIHDNSGTFKIQRTLDTEKLDMYAMNSFHLVLFDRCAKKHLSKDVLNNVNDILSEPRYIAFSAAPQDANTKTTRVDWIGPIKSETEAPGATIAHSYEV
jgi:hypothetical protein